MEYTIDNNNLHLVDSYKVSKHNFKSELENIKLQSPGYDVWNRGIPQMELELAVHNFFYCIGIARERTKDCDINYPQGFLERAAYAVLGCIVWIFIK